MNYNYLLIFQRNIKISLLAKNGAWKFNLSGVDWIIPDFMERLYAYLVFGEKNTSEIASALRANYKQITTIEIDDFISHFIDTHATESVECSLNDIPVYATENNPLCVPNPFSYAVTISPKQEEELLSIIKNNPESAQSRIEQWFDWYVHKYGLLPRLKRDVYIQGKELCLQFCRQHGVSVLNISGGNKNIVAKASIWKIIKRYIFLITVFVVYIFTAILLMKYGGDLTGAFLINLILETIGWLMLGVPLYLIFKNNNTVKHE